MKVTVLDNTKWMRLPSTRSAERVIPVFLGGSVQGAPDWQSDFIEKLKADYLDDKIEVFNPRVENHTFAQAEIEADALAQCLERGIVLFFVCKDAESWTSMLEIGEVLTKYTTKQNVIVVLEESAYYYSLRTESIFRFTQARWTSAAVSTGTLDTMLNLLADKLKTFGKDLE